MTNAPLRLVVSILAFATVAVAQTATVLLHDTFDQNDGGWREQRTSWIRTQVSEGVLRVQTVVNRQQYVVRDVGLDPTANFDIECTVEILGGNEEWPYGLVWGYENRANFLEYLIWMDGRLRIDRNSSLATEELTDTIRSPDVETGPAANMLKLSRRGERLLFYVNGTQQGEIPFSAAIGSSVGFVIWAEIDARFDNLVVTQY